MKGVRFYLEYPSAADKRKATRRDLGNHSGNVIAAFEGTEQVTKDGLIIDALAAIFDRPDSPVAGSAVSLEFIREKCKRISEAQAASIHPELFRRFDVEK